MTKVADILVTPPASTRTRSSSADAELVDLMAKNIKEGQYVTDAKTYKTYGEAGNAAQVYRRAVATAADIEPHKITGKTWGMKGDVLLTDRKAEGQWRFALSVDPSRAKRTRKPAAAAA